MEEYHHHYYYPAVPQRSATAAVFLELLPGFLIHTFGIGHMYSGRVLLGLLVMFGYWIALGINILLCFILIGFITLPLTWIAMLIASPLIAAQACAPR